MKKNVMMRVASIMLVLVLMSSSVISGTFAKYVTAGDAKDTARVAKWGVEFDNDSDLFEEHYDYDVESNKHDASWTYSVKSQNGDVVAPGTTGDAFNLTTTGTPEVSYIVEFDVVEAQTETIFLLKDKNLNTCSYYPVEFTLTIGTNNVPITSNNASDLAAAIEGVAYFFEVTTGNYYCRTTKTGNWISCGNTAPVMNLSWVWDFYNSDSDDLLDTMLGNLAADAGKYTSHTEGTDYNLEVAVTINAKATQID